MNSLKRELGLFTCIMLVIGNIIGVGIFTTPGEIARNLPSSGWVLLAWLIGGLMATAGALTYAELGAMFPQAGGNYVFLREAYGRIWGFLYGWAYTLVTSSGTIALLAIGFSNYLGIPESSIASKTLSLGSILILTWLNVRGVKIGGGVMDVITSTKIIAMVFLVVAGFTLGNGSSAHFSPFISQAGGSVLFAIAAALVPMAFAYSGWNSTVIVSEEIKNPSRLIPLSLILGTLATTLIYILMNAVYLYAVPLDKLVGEEKIAHVAAEYLFGPWASNLIKILVSTSVLGCLSASLLTNPRTTFALGRDGLFFKFTGRVHPVYGTPAGAILFQGLWACILVLLGDFEHILKWLSVPLVIIAAMTVFSIFVFRRTHPHLDRPYRCWGYPIVPLLYVLISLLMIGTKIMERGKLGLYGLGLFAAGVPIYFLWQRFYPSPSETRAD